MTGSVLVGNAALWLALGLAVYGALVSVAAARTGRASLLASGRAAAGSVLLAVLAAVATMVSALLRDDFSVRYVAEVSSRATPSLGKVLALWAADTGSLLLWNLVLAGFLAGLAWRQRRVVTAAGAVPEATTARAGAVALATLHAVSAFYLLLVVGPARSFVTLRPAVRDGGGLPPLLADHPLMAVHPPTLYIGLIATTVPFALALGSLLAPGHDWAGAARRPVLLCWWFLTAGLALGSLWSYGVLGWGGYWAWDPVENVALLPWLVMTALLHTLRVGRLGVLRTWNLALAVSAFLLATFGTFLTRGNVLLSVHSFADSATGPLFLGFLIVAALVGYGLLLLRSSVPGDARPVPGSRESALLANNLVLLSVAAVVLLGTVYPLMTEALTDRKAAIGAPYFDQTTGPLFLLLLFLMGIGPLLPWRTRDLPRLRQRVTGPAVLAALVVAALAVGGLHSPEAAAGLGLATFAGATALLEAVRPTLRAGRRRGPGAAAREVTRSSRRYGGALAHTGIALAAGAILASSTWSTQTELDLATGGHASFAGYTITLDHVTTQTTARRSQLIATVTARRAATTTTLTPALRRYPSGAELVAGPSIRVGPRADLYISLLGVSGSGQRATLRVYRNVGVIWLWIGCGLVLLGGALCGVPAAAGRRRRRAVDGVPPRHAGDDVPAQAAGDLVGAP
jgi:cytochrome c-type biogenesis protein CcmF